MNRIVGRIALLVTLAVGISTATANAQGWTIVGWNDLGMHCTDGTDFSVFSVLPPYNTIHAHVFAPDGSLVSQPSGIVVTYQAVYDPDQSINRTSIGKTNFWIFVSALFGVSKPADTGLAGFSMPGAANVPQTMIFDPSMSWFTAEGIPLTPYPDGAFTTTPPTKNYYPLMRLTVWDTSGNVLAFTDIVLPISDEMDCRSCHASGSNPPAEPSAGWVYKSDPNQDVKFNILRLHDERQAGNAAFQAGLSHFGYSSQGLEKTVTDLGTPILCASCHSSNALGTPGYSGISQFTSAMHALHAGVVDPTNGMTLDASANRFACYRCHPGAATKCLRGAMGNAVADDGSMAIQCQNCHGSMSRVGDPSRMGWLNEPNCQACHTGTATKNSGQIRYTSVFTSSGQMRIPADSTFATNPDTPAANLSLYRFSAGHGGVQCEGCHGSTHAIFPSSHRNDNLQSLALQGHVGMLSDCPACHGSNPANFLGGPHGMHPVGQSWATGHGDAVEGQGTASCTACHGSDYRGTVLSRSLGDRSVTTGFGTIALWRGFQVSCYACHNGPGSESLTTNRPPVASNAGATTTVGTPVALALAASDPDGNALSFRVVSQPAHGTAGLSGSQATYFPEPGFTGTDGFTFAAWDGKIDSNLASATVVVQNVVCSINCTATVPATALAGSAVAFQATSSLSGCGGAASYDWDFGDGTPHGTTGNATHTYAQAGTFPWTLVVSSGGTQCTKTGSITVAAVSCSLSCSAKVPGRARLGRPVAFQSSAGLTGCSGAPTFDWNFGDGTPHAASPNVSHTYSSRGTYSWRLTVSANGVVCSRAGTITVR